MKELIINGKSFVVVEKVNIPQEYEYVRCKCVHTLYDFFDKPNLAKRKLWREWFDWSNNTHEITALGAYSANNFRFTLLGIAEINNIKYGIFINGSSQIAFIIE